ncbi:hypothetical protein ACFRI7_11770 [Streptomyces sp. NPDC056716]|uniref:hypothetical protein n=1 Tax=unclassified Streptomyces TaxID=2593676 RepID=UPI00368BE501
MTTALDSLASYATWYKVVAARWDTALHQHRGPPQSAKESPAAGTARDTALSVAAQDLLLPYTATLLAAARRGVDSMPAARHHAGWRLVLDDLEHAAEQAQNSVDAGPADEAELDARLWPFLRTWGERAVLVRDLALQADPPPRPLPSLGPQEEMWTDHARTARARGLLIPQESWYERTGQLITVATAIAPGETGQDQDDEVVLALAGDIDSPAVRVIGHYDSREAAWFELPPPVPPGVLHPTRTGARPIPGPTVPFLVALTQDVLDAPNSPAVAGVLSHLTGQPPYPTGHLTHLANLLDMCAAWATAMETRTGAEMAVRLRMLSAQVGHLTAELTTVRDDMAEAEAVLPPHRIPAPRHLPPTGHVALTPSQPPRIPPTAPATSSARHR